MKFLLYICEYKVRLKLNVLYTFLCERKPLFNSGHLGVINITCSLQSKTKTKHIIEIIKSISNVIMKHFPWTFQIILFCRNSIIFSEQRMLIEYSYLFYYKLTFLNLI